MKNEMTSEDDAEDNTFKQQIERHFKKCIKGYKKEIKMLRMQIFGKKVKEEEEDKSSSFSSSDYEEVEAEHCILTMIKNLQE